MKHDLLLAQLRQRIELDASGNQLADLLNRCGPIAQAYAVMPKSLADCFDSLKQMFEEFDLSQPSKR